MTGYFRPAVYYPLHWAEWLSFHSSCITFFYEMAGEHLDFYLVPMRRMETHPWLRRSFLQEKQQGKQERVDFGMGMYRLLGLIMASAWIGMRLINHKYSYRLRIGDYRVFFEFDGEVKIVSIEEVKKRNERTY